MPQFYETDSLQCWIHSAISEKYEMDEDKEYLLRITSNIKNLEDETCDLLSLENVGCESSLYRAILNTIDFPDLLASLKEQFEDDLEGINSPDYDSAVLRCCRNASGCPQCVSDNEAEKPKELEVIYDKEAGIDKMDKAFST